MKGEIFEEADTTFQNGKGAFGHDKYVDYIVMQPASAPGRT